jgi:ribose transport system substrate-binding protein
VIEPVRAPAASRAAQILVHLARTMRPMTATAIARDLDLPRTSVQGICEALGRERMLQRGVDDSYWLGARVSELSAMSRSSAHRALRFGLLIATRDNAYYTAMLDAAHSDIRAVGGELLVRDAGEDGPHQRQQWRELLEDDVDVILIDAVETHGFDELVRETRRRAIPVVAVGSRIDDIDASVTSDNTQAGLLAGHELATRVEEGSAVGIVDGLRKDANQHRVAGFVEAIRMYPHLRIVSHDSGLRDSAEAGRAAAARSMARADPPAAIFAVCDPVAFGVADYVSSCEVPVAVASVDGRERAVQQIQNGGPIVATVAQDPSSLIRTALDVARELRNGMRPSQRVVELPVRLITSINAGGYTPWA